MSLIGDIIDRLLAPLFEKIKQIFAPFGKAFNLVGRFWDQLTTILTRTQSLVELVVSEVGEWRNFRENVAFRTKLVSIPAAIEHVQDFIAEVRAAWSAVVDLVNQLKGKFETTGNPTEEAEEAIADIQNSGFKTIIEKFPKLFKGLEKLLGALAILLDAFESISAGIDDLTAIVNALRDLRIDVESGGPLFLQQSNRRKSLRLREGGSIRIRVGKLHQL
jgi:hypothetical protein